MTSADERADFQTRYLDSLGDRPTFNSDCHLPRGVRVCRDFRVAVPIGSGTGTSIVYKDVAPISAEISDEELGKREEQFEELGETWQYILHGMAFVYGEVFRANLGFCPGRPRGDEAADRWLPWLRENNLSNLIEAVSMMFDIVCMDRALNLEGRVYGKIFDRIFSAGGIPCGTDGEHRYNDHLEDLPETMVVYWPWQEMPIIET